MKTVGAFEAKTHLNKLLQQVSKGESIRITLRGVPVAKLIPDREGEQRDLKRIVSEIREICKGASLGGVTIRELIDEGRRF
jgi:prevent-host-death family protein